MRLKVVVGYREYFFPKPLRVEALLEVLRVFEPEATMPPAGWGLCGEESPYHLFLFEAETQEETDARVDLYLEYIEDSSAPVDTVVVALPFASFFDQSDGAASVSDRRAMRFVQRAKDRLGESNVLCTSLFLSENTQAVLKRLRTTYVEGLPTGDPRSEATARRSRASRRDSARSRVTTASVAEFGDSTGVIEDMRRNYSHAVLELCDQIVAKDNMFSGCKRAELVADCLDENQLLIRPDIQADRILEELRPGGQLFDLLSKPLPILAEPNEIVGKS